MKKLFLSLMLLATVGSAMAQTPEEKAAQKAAAAAAKAAQKEVNTQIKNAIKLKDEAKTLMFPDPVTKKPRTAQDTVKIVKNCTEALELIHSAEASGLIPEKQMYDVALAKKETANFIMNYNISKHGKMPYDTIACCSAIADVTDGMEGIIKYAKKNDEAQANQLKLEKMSLPRMAQLMGYRCYFYTLIKDMKMSESSLDDYMNFSKRFPEVANEPFFANPDPAYAFLAYNIYFTAYDMKDYALMNKYYDLAIQIDDENGKAGVKQRRLLAIQQSGSEQDFENAVLELAKAEPNSNDSETAIWNLFNQYAKKGDNKQLDEYTVKCLEANPDSKSANICRGRFLKMQKKNDDAIKHLEKAAEIDATEATVFELLGECYYDKGNENNKKIFGKQYKTKALADAALEKEVKVYMRKAIDNYERAISLSEEGSDIAKYSKEQVDYINGLLKK